MNHAKPGIDLSRSTTAFRERWIAEAVRLDEDRLGAAYDDSGADRKAGEVGGDFEQRLVVRAGALAAGRQYRAVIERLRGPGIALMFLLVIMGLMAGGGAAAAVFGRDPLVNIGWALSLLLGIPTLMLFLWTLWAFLPIPRHSGQSLTGRAALGFFRLALRRTRFGTPASTLFSALVGLLRSSTAGRWSAGVLTHAFWLAFVLGALIVATWAMAVRQYDFVWGTTLLSPEHVVALLSILGAPAQSVGWTVPDPDLIRASRLGLELVGGRESWSTLLLTTLVFFGLLPRLLLLILAGVLAARALGRIRLDTSMPGYARLVHRVGVQARYVGVTDPEPVPEPAQAGRSADLSSPPLQGEIVLVGFELERTRAQWPPELPGITWRVLGRADDRAQEVDVLAGLGASRQTVGVVLALCSLARTPDRGALRFLQRLRAVAPIPLWLVLDEGARSVSRGIDMPVRLRQWQDLGRAAGADRIVEVELDDPEHEGSLELRERLLRVEPLP